jgi:hypothetical protein
MEMEMEMEMTWFALLVAFLPPCIAVDYTISAGGLLFLSSAARFIMFSVQVQISISPTTAHVCAGEKNSGWDSCA